MTDATHAYVVFHGGFLDWPLETWQVGVRFMLVNSGTEPDHVGTLPTFGVVADATGRDETDWTISNLWNADLGLAESIQVDDWLNDQLAPAFVGMMADCYISTQVTATGIKVSPITGTGHVADLRVSQLLFKSTVPHGTVSVPMLPAECSVVGSWITQRIGRKGRGRIYLPPTGSAVISDGAKPLRRRDDHPPGQHPPGAAHGLCSLLAAETTYCVEFKASSGSVAALTGSCGVPADCQLPTAT
jgi:hypothetical protein